MRLSDFFGSLPPAAAEAWQQRQHDERTARALIRQLREAGRRPLVEWRCECGRGLLTAWYGPSNTLLVEHPRVRWTPYHMTSDPWPGAAAHIPVPRQTGSALVLEARAYAYEPGAPLYVHCEHRSGNVAGSDLEDDVRAARTTHRTTVRVVPVEHR